MLNSLTRALTSSYLASQDGEATNKSAILKRVYRCWHENPREAAVGIYVELSVAESK
jgi:hypothetical protein